MANTYPIKGIPLTRTGDIPTRQEITAWYNNEDNKYQVSLFMLAMAKFKLKPIGERLSYFQIAGIHCFPIMVGWDGEDPQITPLPNDPNAGYCNHNMVTFPTWHRPYMLLYEQVLHGIMIEQIETWKAKGLLQDELQEDLWRAGAAEFRLPYWDWARKQTYDNDFSIPEICKSEYVTILLPSGIKDKPFPNPLIRFTNPTVDSKGNDVPMGDHTQMGDNQILDDIIYDNSDPPVIVDTLPWSRCVGTSRFGINEDLPDDTWVNGKDDWEQVNQAMQQPLWYGKDGGSFSHAVSRMLSPNYFDSWETFASTLYNPQDETNTQFLSLEYIHNVIHNTVGGGFKSAADKDKHPEDKGYQGVGLGHMSDVPVAAFDPIFWFHHCNIDRLAAIWQTFNDEKWFKDPKEGIKSLRPFHCDESNTPWISNNCKDWTKLLYQYDDLIPSAAAKNPDGTTNKAKFLPELRSKIDLLYPPTGHQVSRIPHYISSTNKFDDYVINIIYDRYALNGHAYSILFFLGEPPEDLAAHRTSKNFVGQLYTFSAPILPDGQGCSNCAAQKTAGVLSKAQIPLTIPLLAKLQPRQEVPPGDSIPTPGLPGDGLGWFAKDKVEVHLKAELNWRFVQLGGRERPETDFPFTEIAVLRGVGHHVENANGTDGKPLFSGYKRVEFDERLEGGENRRLGTKKGNIRDDPEV